VALALILGGVLVSVALAARAASAAARDVAPVATADAGFPLTVS
jgi:hypothetical protein